MKSLSNVKFKSRFIFFCTFLVIVFGLNKYIALDVFIDGAEKIFFPENSWALDLFYQKVYPFWGYTYFIADFIFALSIVWLIPALFRKVFKRKGLLKASAFKYQKLKDVVIYKKLFFIPFIYLLFDILEGVLNLFLINQYDNERIINTTISAMLPLIGGLKALSLILLVIITFFIYVKEIEVIKIIDGKKGNSTLSRIKGTFYEILKGNYISIIVSSFIFYLILKNDQGKTLLLELVHTPWSLLFIFTPLVILLSLMTLINSYYTSYPFYKKTKEKNEHQVHKYFNWNLLNYDSEAAFTRKTQGNIKRYLTLSYSLMTSVLFINLSAETLKGPSLSFLGYLVTLILIISVFYFVNKSNTTLKKLERFESWSTSDGSLTKKYLKRFSLSSSIAGIITIMSLLNYIVLAIIATYGFLWIKTILMGIFFSAFTFYLAHIVLIRRSKKNFLNKPSRLIKNILANDKNLIQSQRVLGYLITVISIILFFTNFDLFFDSVKSINIILIYVFLAFWYFYLITSSMVFAIDKLMSGRTALENPTIPVEQKNSILNQIRNSRKTIASLNLFIVILFGLLIKSSITNNQYFSTKLIPLSEKNNTQSIDDTEGISLKKYFKDRVLNNTSKDFYLIANEGGGLRANYWSLLVLSKLEKIADSLRKEKKDTSIRFYGNTLATSGASGGSIGQSLFNLMKADGKNIINDNTIEEIGTTDHLASDLFSLCFRRPIVYLIPLDLSEKEHLKTIRGDYYASRRYARMALDEGSNILNKSTLKPFKSFWKEAYENNQKLYPLTIINSTHAEYGTEGIGSPLTEADNKKIFNGSVSYLEINQNNTAKSISFIDAAFLANRFPLISSPAIIPTKGHFIDAGAFDNNGISSLLNIVSYIQEKAKLDDEWKEIWNTLKGKLKVIIIANGKGTYIKNKYDDLRITHGGKLFKSSNLKGSLGAAISTSAMKEYLEREANKLDCTFDNVIRIDLPYILKKERSDVQNTLRIQITDTSLEGKIRTDNNIIKEYLKKRNYNYEIYLDPPLGRSLSQPVADYMEYMADYVVEQKAKEVFE